MEMSGNLMEQCYNLAIFNTGAVGGGTFAGGHGDGELTSTPHAGYANAGWPKEIYEIPFQEGYAVARKGGSTIYTQERLAVSDRNFVILAGATLTELRREDCGGRGVSRR
jgi:hypothetical protein